MLIFPFGEKFLSPCTLVLGGFDGLHRGHRTLISAAKKNDFPVVLTTMFGAKGKQLFLKEEREFLFGRAKINAVCEIRLAGSVQELSPEEFLKQLFSTISLSSIVCGQDFRFGKGAEGTTELLKKLAPCPVTVVQLLSVQSEGQERKLSTSLCKEYLKKGEISSLNACLYSSEKEFSDGYFVQGTVEHGREVGRTMGFPTLNLSISPEKLLPKSGVYGGIAMTPKGNFPCIINFGPRPTFGVKESKIEAHLLGFSGDLYGEEVRVYPTEFFRPITKFSSAEELKFQLEKDVEHLRGNIS